ncbi:MAG: ATP-binding protein [Candidatus Tectomicrobia bacterium]|nr:ATP-binding protein [Candidatus Tectomicrobia bacterium]
MRRLPVFWRLFIGYMPAVALALLVLLFLDYPARVGQSSILLAGSLIVGSLLAMLAAVFGMISSLRVSRSLRAIRASAEHFAEGDFSHRLRIPNTAETGNLAVTLNNMAAQLEEQIRVVTQQRNEQEAILSSMQEGVLALDPQAHVIALNPAAEALLTVPASQARGRTVQEVIRNVGLQRLLTDALSKAEPTTGEIVLRGEEERFVQVTATALRDAAARDLGMLVVLNDITQLRWLENIRRDFVANVSHELKTPITSIKGFVETLRDGALADPPQAERFLEIVARHADRLNAIIEDLLSLSRLEQANQAAEIPRPVVQLSPILEAAVLDCSAKAAARQITILPSCAAGLFVEAKAPLLEQAIVNLLDNAISYSNPAGTVWLTARRGDVEVCIDVRDEGIGIAPEHVSRIFERFYRTDRARDRASGGTGLGLAIVKHIVQIHDGYVDVNSDVGQGSTFSLRLPLPETGLNAVNR